MKATKTNAIKKIISWAIGLPCGLIAVSEVEDLNLWWIQFVAIGLLALILFWNGAFEKDSRELTFYKKGFYEN